MALSPPVDALKVTAWVMYALPIPSRSTLDLPRISPPVDALKVKAYESISLRIADNPSAPS